MVKSDIKIDIYKIVLDRQVKHLLQCKLWKCNHLTKIFKWFIFFWFEHIKWILFLVCKWGAKIKMPILFLEIKHKKIVKEHII